MWTPPVERPGSAPPCLMQSWGSWPHVNDREAACPVRTLPRRAQRQAPMASLPGPGAPGITQPPTRPPPPRRASTTSSQGSFFVAACAPVCLLRVRWRCPPFAAPPPPWCARAALCCLLFARCVALRSGLLRWSGVLQCRFAVFCAAGRAVVPRLSLLWAAARCAVFDQAAFTVLCCAFWLLLRDAPCLWSCRPVAVFASSFAVWLWSALPCAVLCCVPGCGAARSFSRHCAVVCCVVWCCSFGAAACCAVRSGAARRPGVPCFPVFCGVPPRCVLCAVCVLSWCVGACSWSPLCFVLCASWGVVLCVPCLLCSVWCCAAMCWCVCVVLFVWCALVMAAGAVVRCCVLCCFPWCSVVRCCRR